MDDRPYYADDDYPYDDRHDPFQEAIDNCYMTREGVCMAAGSEHCDWDCKLHKYWDEVFASQGESDEDE